MSLLSQVDFEQTTQAKLAWLYDQLRKTSNQVSELLEGQKIIEARLALVQDDMKSVHRSFCLTLSMLIASLLALAFSISSLTTVLLKK